MTMEPGEFRKQVEDVVVEALDEGLHPSHVLNNLQAVHDATERVQDEHADEQRYIPRGYIGTIRADVNDSVDDSDSNIRTGGWTGE